LVSLIVALLLISLAFRSKESQLPYAFRRTGGIILTAGLVTGTVILYLEDSDFIRFSLAAYYAIGGLCQLGLLWGVKQVKHFYFIHDMVCGHIICIPLFLLAALHLPHHIQTWLLYHNALSTDVVVSNILRYARKSQQEAGNETRDEDLNEQVAELRKLVQKQEQMLMSVGLTDKDGSSLGPRTNSTDAISSLVTPGAAEMEIIRPSTAAITGRSEGGGGGISNRALSMTGLDVWSSMAIGDTTSTDQRSTTGRYQGAATEESDQRGFSQLGGFQFSQPDTMPPR
jgi:callose synthase